MERVGLRTTVAAIMRDIGLRRMRLSGNQHGLGHVHVLGEKFIGHFE